MIKEKYASPDCDINLMDVEFGILSQSGNIDPGEEGDYGDF